MYNLEFDLEKRDFIQLGVDLLSIKKYNKKYITNGSIAIVLIYLISILIFRNAMSIVYATLVSLLVLFSILNNGQSMYKIAKDSGLNRKYIFDDTNFSVDSNGIVIRYAYSDIKELYNTKNNIIFVCKQDLLFVPKNRTVNINLYDFIKRKSNI